MKNNLNLHFIKAAMAAVFVMLVNITVLAQDEVTVDTGEAQSWISNNWIWVAGAVLLLIILIAAGSGARSRRTTTVRDNPTGTTTTTTTIDEN